MSFSISDFYKEYDTSIAKPMPGAMTLPMTDTRKYLSDVDNIFDGVLQYTIDSEKLYKPADIYDTKNAKEVLSVLVTQFEINAINTSISPKAKLELISKTLASRLKVIDISSNKISCIPFFRKIRSICFETMLFLQTQLDIKELPNVPLAQIDFQKVHEDFSTYQINERIMFCYDYAFFHLNEARAFQFIFNPNSHEQWPDQIFKKPIKFLENWGYTRVDKPNIGDLVVFCSTFGTNAKGKLRVKHWGIYKGENRVISKWGRECPYEHNLQDIPIAYGNFVFFFRKPTSLAFPSIHDELRKMKVLQPSFGHPAFRSPLCINGSLEKITEIFSNHIKNDVSKAMTNSMMGVKWLTHAGDAILKEISAKIEMDCTPSELLSQIEKRVEKSISETPLDFSLVGCAPKSEKQEYKQSDKKLEDTLKA